MMVSQTRPRATSSRTCGGIGPIHELYSWCSRVASTAVCDTPQVRAVSAPTSAWSTPWMDCSSAVMLPSCTLHFSSVAT